MSRDFAHCQRIAVKAGTSILTAAKGKVSGQKLESLGEGILEVMAQKRQVALISSGAIGFGMDVLKLAKRPKDMALLQACAAIGQGKLIHAYEKFFAHHGVHTAQILLTRDGLEQRDRFLKARRTFEELLGLGVLPIVNENDTVATDEIGFGDNDVLSVQVAHLIHADLLIILSDVDGFFLQDGSRVREVGSEEEIDRELMKHIQSKSGEKTVGGMKAKVDAARVAMRLGLPLLIVNGHEESILRRALAGEDVGTFFVPGKGRKNARKKWIAFSAARCGTIVVDEGAYRALQSQQKSLLARGIVKMRGHFNCKDVVELETPEGRVFGRGMVRFTSRDLVQIIGKRNDEIKMIIGEKSPGEVIHRNDLVIWG